MYLPVFEEQTPAPPTVWPRLSVIVPACNEEATIEAALTSLRGQDYPNLELVLINDRSTDATGALIDGIAAADDRVQAVHIDTLPEGWLGKVHALHVGVQRATGTWLLFTDADILFAPGALQRAVGLALEQEVDHVAIGPQVHTPSFLLNVSVRTFAGLFLHNTKAHAVNRPNSDRHIGIGAFNLVRRAAWAQTEGFDWLRLEVADDVGVGLALHRHGARSFFTIAQREVAVEWYPTLGAMFKGMEKNLFAAAAGYRLSRALVAVVGMVLLCLAPVVALLYPVPYLWVGGVLTMTAVAAGAVAGATRFGQPLGALLLAPLGLLLVAAMLLRSTVQTLRRGGVEWRGTRYDLEALRHAQRVRV
ncbi:MAG: glycosyltransferase family 2 protein [Bacteroidota bacterium]